MTIHATLTSRKMCSSLMPYSEDEGNGMKLSIIIPYYNTKVYTDELLKILDRQMTDETECILVDDGSAEPYIADYPWLRIIRQNNGGVSRARNTGIDNAKGEYISFIDSDDTVPDYYVEKILRRIEAAGFDYLEFSWRSMPEAGIQYVIQLQSEHDRLENPSVCTRAFKKSFIGSTRFNENKDAAEDADFIRKLDLSRGKRSVETSFMYFYRTYVENSKSKRYTHGLSKTRRIVYYVDHVAAGNTELLNEIREEDKDNEVFLLTNRCDMPEITKYCALKCPPVPVRGHELRGKFTPYFIQLDVPIKYQVIIYAGKLHEFGGLETFIYNFCVTLRHKYDIMVLYDDAAFSQITRLSEFVKVSKRDYGRKYSCNTLIMNSILDEMPKNIICDKKVQMCHTCKIKSDWTVPQDNDCIVYPSEVAKKSFNDNHATSQVIPNPLVKAEDPKALILVTASRLSTFEKGKERMLALARILNEHKVNYIWLVFSDCEIAGAPKQMIFMGQSRHAESFIKSADYLVQLSDSESFCYSIMEAKSHGVAVITTPLPILEELGIKNKVNGYIVPFNMKDIDVDAIVNHIPKGFAKSFVNDRFVKSWVEILGDEPPKHRYDPGKMVMVEVIRDYLDVALNEKLIVGTKLLMPAHRAETVKAAGCIKIVGGGV